MTTIDNRRSPAPLPIITTFGWVPEAVRGLVRDVRVRWALEEAGLPYQVKLIGFDEKNTPSYRALQPFGQVPAYQDGALTLFESGAIVHHIAARSAALMPHDEAGRSHTLMWMFAALNSVEPSLSALWEHDHADGSGEAAVQRREVLLKRVQDRLAALEGELDARDYLVKGFTAADILMTCTLRIINYSDVLSRYPSLQAYLARCSVRPAASKALADHLAVFALEAKRA